MGIRDVQFMTWGKFSSQRTLSVTILVFLNLIFAGSSCEIFSLIDTSFSTSGLTKGITFNDPSLEVELIFAGLELADPDGHSSVSKMAFLGPDDLLILDKNEGQVRRILNGTLLPNPLLDISVANERERGLLGIAVASYNNSSNNFSKIVVAEHQNISPSSIITYVFLYFTQSRIPEDGVDDCPAPKPYYCKESGEPIGNRVYRYELADDSAKLINPKLLLDVPVKHGPIHNGGTLLMGPDKNLYIGIGDALSYYSRDAFTETLNFENGSSPDGRGGILRITQDGKTVGEGRTGMGESLGQVGQGSGILGTTHPLNK
jgi:hypothetical protein